MKKVLPLIIALLVIAIAAPANAGFTCNIQVGGQEPGQCNWGTTCIEQCAALYCWYVETITASCQNTNPEFQCSEEQAETACVDAYREYDSCVSGCGFSEPNQI